MSNARDKANIPSLNFSSTGIDDNATSTAITINSSEQVAFTDGTASLPSITNLADENTGMFFPAANQIGFATNGSETVRINANGAMALGTNTIADKLHVFNGSTGTNTGSAIRLGQGYNSVYSRISSNFGGSMGLYAGTGTATAQLSMYTNSILRQRVNSNGDVYFYEDTGTTPKFVWDASAERLGIGTTSPQTELHVVDSAGVVSGASYRSSAPLTLERTGGVELHMIADNSGYGQLRFGDADATMRGALQYDHSSDAMLLYTSATERMRIDSSGNVGIGTSSPGSPLTVSGGTNTTVANINNNVSATTSVSNTLLLQTNSTGSAGVGFGLSIAFNGERNDGNTQRFGNVSWQATTNSGTSLATDFFISHYGGTETFRVKQNGRLVRNSGALASAHGNFIGEVGSSYKALSFSRTSGGSEVGNVVANTSSTSYNTSSDYRLKENIVEITDATTRLKQLKPARFNFIADTDTTVDGFIAHEVSSVVPEAITGTKDETETKEKVVVNANGNVIEENIEQADWEAGKIADEDGNTKYPTDSTWEATKVVPVYQGIDQSKLVPLLVKTIQELEARITALETTTP